MATQSVKPAELASVLEHVESGPFLSDYDLAVLEMNTRTRSDTARLLSQLAATMDAATYAVDDPISGLVGAGTVLNLIRQGSATGLLGDSGDISSLLRAMAIVQAAQDGLRATVHQMLREALRPEFPTYTDAQGNEHTAF